MEDTRKPTQVIVTLKNTERDYLLKLVQDKNNNCGFTYRITNKLSKANPQVIPYKSLLNVLKSHGISSVEELERKLTQEPKREDE